MEFRFNISPSNEHSELISFRMDLLDLRLQVNKIWQNVFFVANLILSVGITKIASFLFNQFPLISWVTRS